jgi:hypothetical protein
VAVAVRKLTTAKQARVYIRNLLMPETRLPFSLSSVMFTSQHFPGKWEVKVTLIFFRENSLELEDQRSLLRVQKSLICTPMEGNA